MFILNERYEIDWIILNCDCIKNSSSELSTINTANSQIHITYTAKIVSLLSNYPDLKFEVNKEADNSRYANGNDIRLVILGPIVYSVIKKWQNLVVKFWNFLVKPT